VKYSSNKLTVLPCKYPSKSLVDDYHWGQIA
jgi:hypothetical protein